MNRELMLELAERVQAAEEGCLYLNKQVLAALGYTWRGMAYWHHDDTHTWRGPATITQSVDAAIAFVPEGREGLPLSFKVERFYLGNAIWKSRACVWDGLGGVSALDTASEAATPALALTAAALRARASLMDKD